MTPARVLVLDDEGVSREILARVLRREGMQVEVFEKPDDALARIALKGFDLVVTDLMMPGTNGFDFVRALREHNPCVPTLIVTGYGSVQSAKQATSLGVVGYVLEPFTHRELAGAAHLALRAARPLGALGPGRLAQAPAGPAKTRAPLVEASPRGTDLAAWLFGAGDCLASVLCAVVTALAVRTVVSPAWDVALAMVAGMAIGTVVHLALGLLAAPALGVVQSMIASGVAGMYGGMLFGMRDAMHAGPTPWHHVLWVGIAFGLLVYLGVAALDRVARGVVFDVGVADDDEL
jgi:CheY-like chemotaxis protein